MKFGIRLKINVSQVNKEKLFPGKKGKYLDATVFFDPDNTDQYGNNGAITQDTDRGEDKIYIGRFLQPYRHLHHL